MSLFRARAGPDGGDAPSVAPDSRKSEATCGSVPLTFLDRAYFAFVGVFALWVGVWGMFVPAEVDKALPWLVPPFHARVIGAFYLSGLVLMVACMLRRDRRAIDVGLAIAVVWTGMLLLASLLHLGEFDPANPRVWFWFFAYVLFPPWGAWLIWRGRDLGPLATAPAPPWIAAGFLVQGVACCVLALLLLVWPGMMAGFWPWKVTVLLAQIYAGPFLSYGVGSLLLTRRGHAAEIMTTATAMATFVVLVLVASLIHRDLLPPESPAVMVWYAGLAASAVFLAVALADRLLARRRSA